MTQDEMIDLAKQAGWQYAHGESGFEPLWDFAKLVEEKATEKANARANASWTLMCKKMVAFEREACAKLCDELSDKHTWEGCYADECATAIRARGEQA
jgi:hypothetical protein